jgi:large subunit ribosomal protein L9
MEIILLERVDKLGQMGDVVRVKDGYARNFLLPQKKALRATKANKERFDEQRAQLEAQNLKRRSEAEAVSGKMGGLTVTLLRQAGETGLLYGSVSARDISDAVTAAGFTVGRQQVLIAAPIKTLGIHQVKLALHPEVTVGVGVNVARSEAEAGVQAAGGTVAGAEQFFEEGAAPAEGDEAEDES